MADGNRNGHDDSCQFKNEPIFSPVDTDSIEYPMNFSNRGKCYIFNHKKFDAHLNLSERECSDKDAWCLYRLFKKMGFGHEDIKTFTNLNATGVLEKLEEAGKEDYSDSSCFICCIMTHGKYGSLYAKDKAYPVGHIFEPFSENACPKLRGKPKIFFIQACQGGETDSGVEVIFKESMDNVPKSIDTFEIPTCSDFFISCSTVPDNIFEIINCPDFLIMCSSIPGYRSWRKKGPKKGTWFIQSLCKVLTEHVESRDLLSLLTIVSRRVAFEYESHVPEDTSKHKKKQMPVIYSTLTRVVKFA